jgi:oxygen-dependent protoporphyrinogen oxidase
MPRMRLPCLRSRSTKRGNEARRRVYVLWKKKLHVLPDGVLLIIPTRFTPFALSSLISPLGKLRMGMDLV